MKLFRKRNFIYFSKTKLCGVNKQDQLYAHARFVIVFTAMQIRMFNRSFSNHDTSRQKGHLARPTIILWEDINHSRYIHSWDKRLDIDEIKVTFFYFFFCINVCFNRYSIKENTSKIWKQICATYYVRLLDNSEEDRRINADTHIHSITLNWRQRKEGKLQGIKNDK